MSQTLFYRLGYSSKKIQRKHYLGEALLSLYLEVMHLVCSEDFPLLLLSLVSQKGNEKIINLQHLIHQGFWLSFLLVMKFQLRVFDINTMALLIHEWSLGSSSIMRRDYINLSKLSHFYEMLCVARCCGGIKYPEPEKTKVTWPS